MERHKDLILNVCERGERGRWYEELGISVIPVTKLFLYTDPNGLKLGCFSSQADILLNFISGFLLKSPDDFSFIARITCQWNEEAKQ